jgi:hypothetical protein
MIKPDGLEGEELSARKFAAILRRECQSCGGQPSEAELRADKGFSASSLFRKCNDCREALKGSPDLDDRLSYALYSLAAYGNRRNW